MKNETRVQPFYFTSYHTIIGSAADVRELERVMKKLARENRFCLEYHLANEHIVRWLEYANEPELAKDLSGVGNIEEALSIVEKHVVRSVAFHSMSHGRKR
jgi:hypothetical protein